MHKVPKKCCHVSETGRYATGFRYEQFYESPCTVGQLSLYLFKQLGPDTFFDLATRIYRTNPDTNCTGDDFQVEIVTGGGSITVYLDETSDGHREQVLTYPDPDPLPPGTIGFETLDRRSGPGGRH